MTQCQNSCSKISLIFKQEFVILHFKFVVGYIFIIALSVSKILSLVLTCQNFFIIQALREPLIKNDKARYISQ